MATVSQQIGRNLALFRGYAGLSQAEMGRALASAVGGKGWTRQAVWKAERGERPFTAAELLALANVLHVTVPQLFETTEPLTLPSGRYVSELVVDGLTRGRKELGILDELRKDFNVFSLAFTRTLLHLRAALAGAPELNSEEPLYGVEAAAERIREDRATRVARAPRLRDYEDITKDSRP